MYYFSCFWIYFVRCCYFSCSFFSKNSNIVLSFFSRTIFFVSYWTWYFCNFYLVFCGNFHYCLRCFFFFWSSYSLCYFSSFWIYFVCCRYFSCSFLPKYCNIVLPYISRTIFFVSYRTWYFCNFHFIFRGYFYYCLRCFFNFWFFYFFCDFSCFRIYFVRCCYFSCSFLSRNSNIVLSFFSRIIFFVSYRTWYFCNFHFIFRGYFYYCLCCFFNFWFFYFFCDFSCFWIYFVRCRYLSCSFLSKNSNIFLSFFSRTIFFVSYRTWNFCNFYFILCRNFYYCISRFLFCFLYSFTYCSIFFIKCIFYNFFFITIRTFYTLVR